MAVTWHVAGAVWAHRALWWGGGGGESWQGAGAAGLGRTEAMSQPQRTKQDFWWLEKDTPGGGAGLLSGAASRLSLEWGNDALRSVF